MDRISDLAIRSERESYDEGAESGFWRGYAEGADDNRRYIMGETDVCPEAPPEFRPLGTRWYPYNFAGKVEYES